MATSRGGVSGAQETDAAPRLAEQLEAIELALKGLHACGRAVVMAPRSTLDLRPAARAAERAVAGALEAYDGRRDIVAALCDAVAATEELEQELGRAMALDPGIEAAVDWAKTSAGWLRKAIGSPASGRMPLPAPLVASIGMVSLHMPARSAIVPTFNVADPLPPPPAPPQLVDPTLPPAERIEVARSRAKERQRIAEERRAARAAAAQARLRRPSLPEVPSGFVPGVHRPLSIDEAILRRARHCFEDVAALGMMRVPQLGEDWRAMATIDERMLATIDAIVSLGPTAIQALESFVVDAPAKDPTRGFAAALVHGSIDGRDGLAAAERALAHLGAGVAENAEAFGEALYLAPNRDVPVLLRRFLGDDEPTLRAMGIACLARKGLATLDELGAALTDDAPEVVAAALVPSALARLPDLQRRCEELMSHSQEDVSRELAWALVLGEVPFALSRLREWMGTSREAFALMPVALAGERDDVESLVDLTNQKATRPRVAALGFGGSPAAIPLFVRLLREAKDDELKLSVAFALQRLTDAPLYDDALIPPENIDVPEPDEPDELSAPTVPLARRVCDPRDLPAEGSPDRATLPSVDPTRWEKWLSQRDEYPREQRLRRGKAFTPAVTLLELSDYLVVPSERRLLHRELVLKTGEAHPFDTSAHVPIQRAQLDKWAGPAERASAEPGAWGRARRRG